MGRFGEEGKGAIGGGRQPLPRNKFEEQQNPTKKVGGGTGMENNFCSKCSYYMHFKANPDGLIRICRECGEVKEVKKDDPTGGLVMETPIQQRTSEAYKVLVNEFTWQDPTLPHLNTIKCPNAGCQSNRGAPKDVSYIQYDRVNMKFQYHCNVCSFEWRSRD